MMISVALLAIFTSLEETEISFSFLNKENCHRIFLTNMDGLVVVQKKDIWNSLKFNVTQTLNENPPPYPPLPTPLSLNSDANNCMNPDITTNLTLKFSRIFSIVLLFAYEIAYTFGFGTLTWIIICELLPTSIRGRGICILNIIHWLTDFLMPINIFQIGKYYTFSNYVKVAVFKQISKLVQID